MSGYEEHDIAGGFKLDWHGRKVIAEIENISEIAVKEGAEAVVRDAKLLVPVDTGDLKKSIHVKTFKKVGVFGAYIKAGENKKEHIAGFVELGTPGTVFERKYRKGQKRTPIKAKPYMRPALKKNKSKIRKAFQNKLK